MTTPNENDDSKSIEFGLPPAEEITNIKIKCLLKEAEIWDMWAEKGGISLDLWIRKN